MENIRLLINDAISKGADYCDVYLQSSVSHSLRFEGGKITENSSSLTEGVGARVVKGDKTFFAHRPGASLKAVNEAFLKASDSAGLSFGHSSSLQSGSLFEGNDILPRPDLDFLHELDRKLRARSKFVKQIVFSFGASGSDIQICAPDGVKKGRKNYTTFAAQVVAEKDGALQTADERSYMSLNPEDFWAINGPEKIAEAAFDRAMLMLDAKQCPAGKMNVYFAGEAGGTIIHEACGHGLEADIVMKDRSVFADKTGERVASELVTMVDDPTQPGLFGSYDFDDEGTEARRTLLIEDGILKNYMTDRLSSRIYDMPLTGNGRRQSYRNAPLPRMSNTFLLPRGHKSEEEMLSIAENGLYVKKMGGGEVDPTTGDFVFYAAEAYLIKDGKISFPVKGASLTGNGPDVLQKIAALGDALGMDPGICGKSGQGVPVTDGQPSMVVRDIIVGGRE